MADRRFLMIALVGIVVCTLSLSAHSQSNTNPGGKSQNTTTKTGTDGALTKAIEMNEAEVELGKIAVQKAENSRVKDFANMMVKDHTDGLMKLRGIQGAPSDVKPNAKHQQTAERLSKLSGAAFDREYMKTMVAGHQEAVRFFEQQSTGSSDLAKLAKELLPTVRQHLQLAEQIQKEVQGGPVKRTS
jgi:putative membrane protein